MKLTIPFSMKFPASCSAVAVIDEKEDVSEEADVGGNDAMPRMEV